MDNTEFKQNALRTESNDFEKIKARLNYEPVATALLGALVTLVNSLEELDSIKKYLFYGKESKFLVQWEHGSHEMIKTGFPTSYENYVKGAKRIASDEKLIRVLHGIIGINTEGGELIESLLKHITGGDELDSINVMEEIGDVNWYEAIISDAMDFSVDVANERVISKLRNRYPEKFTEGHAINRDLETERKTLEGEQ